MYYPKLNEEGNSRSMIDRWYGYNHNYRINAGEFFDMENMSSDQYPLATCRKLRTALTKVDEKDTEPFMRGVTLVNNSVWCLIGTDLVNMSTRMEYDLSSIMDEDDEDHKTKQKMLVMGSYLVIFPLKIYVNLNDLEEMGKLESTFEVDTAGVTISYAPCSLSGAALQNLSVSSTAPNSPSHGDYWICTETDKEGLYYYNGYKSEWEAVATSYIKISIPGAKLTDYFDEGDAVFMNTKLPDINEGSVIQKLDDTYMVVIGFMDQATDSQTTSGSWTFKAERRVPDMDYVCMDKNRIWGCHYGYNSTAKKTVNEIYASKMGDFKNWYVYQGLSTDSYAVTVGEIGQFTGCISFQGYPHFFKENMIYKIFGDYPAEYHLNEYHGLGVQEGSGESLAIVGEYLLYKGVSDVVIYDGSSPVSISQALSRTDMYYDAIGGGCQNKYYVEMQTEAGGHRLFVYDTQYGIWEKETPMNLLEFTVSQDGQLYAITEHNLYGLGAENNAVYVREEALKEEWVDWFAETGELGYEYPDYKYVSRITLRAYVPIRSEIEVQISYDDAPYTPVGILRGHDDITTQSLAFTPLRCDHFKIRMEGHGECRIYSLAFTMELGSEE